MASPPSPFPFSHAPAQADEARDLNTAFSTSPRNVEAYLERPDEYWMAMAGKLALSITNAHVSFFFFFFFCFVLFCFQ